MSASERRLPDQKVVEKMKALPNNSRVKGENIVLKVIGMVLTPKEEGVV